MHQVSEGTRAPRTARQGLGIYSGVLKPLHSGNGISPRE
jgi:hypothetical protein